MFDGRDSTKAVWRAYETLRALMMKQFPTQEERLKFGPVTLQYMLMYRMRYPVKSIHYYCHVTYAHMPAMMTRFKSLGLYRNESEECAHSEDKRWIAAHSMMGGCGSHVTYDRMLKSIRKMYRFCRQANLDWYRKNNYDVDEIMPIVYATVA